MGPMTSQSQTADQAGTPVSDEDEAVLTRDAFVKARRGRNLAIAFSLVGFAVLLFLVTLVKLGPGAVVRPL